jgi:hypothetical protein
MPKLMAFRMMEPRCGRAIAKSTTRYDEFLFGTLSKQL